ncbi:hypothetical protein [Methylocystis bryophila]|uniref:Uncharacterized protein n=1 Tax=Methylocystis bryophila TaxID=655015 RepID=A0A1W6MYS3_9HYPH|nr:hypothetical protein [Methylocystis bryophila]ARN82689.1 hypothetical protein B1812_18110 [Methylocystis bryophila]BDV38911.1 hypothetical protein DSM21852_21640 [Methylocystis bryophila]
MALRSLAAWILTALLSLAIAAPEARARGALTLNQDVCLLYIGPDYAYFSAYDPHKPKKRYCEEAPRTGVTVFAIDFAQSEMREMKVAFRVLRNIGETTDPAAIEAATLARTEPRVYPTGSLSLAYDFKEPGDYAGLVTVDGPNGEQWVAYFPFAVAQPYRARLPYYLLGVAGLLAIFVIFWGKDQRGKKPEPKRG